MPQNIGDNRIDDQNIARITEQDALRLSRYLLRSGDIVYSRRGDVERRALVRLDQDGWLCGTGCLRVRFGDGPVVPEFAAYYLAHPTVRAHIVQHAIGATMPNLNTSILSGVPFLVPPMVEQVEIASLLGALDDKIELNRRLNETLEAMARAMFKDWFVDFGPTRAKAEGRAPYLAPELWDMFPDAMDDEGKPAGWLIYSLRDLAQHHRTSLSPGAQPERTFEHYSIPAYDAGNEPAMDLGGSIKSNKTIVPDGAVLLSKLNPDIERVWLPNPAGEAPQVASTEFLALTPLAPATRGVLYCLLKSLGFRAEMAARVTGTSKSHQRVPPKSILACEVLAANPCLLAVFDETVAPIMYRFLLNRQESRELALTRDLLLPKLMSGEIRLREAERQIEAAA